jgi:hypothetical protein
MTIEPRRDFAPDDAWQRARHVLFVEGPPGQASSSFDQVVLSALLQDVVQVEALGASFHLRSAAEALYPFHPTYYFLIDRDHHDDAFVARTWERFPDPATYNLLVWPRRELENYFIDPAFLLHSQHLNVDEEALRTCIRSSCRRRLYLDVANQVITDCREPLKERWIRHFDAIEALPTRESALAALRDHPSFAAKREAFAACTHPDALTARFVAVLEDFTGGRDPLEFGAGRWLERLRGKEVWPTVAARCFRIADAQGRPLQGPRKELELAKALLRRPLVEQPADLQRLHQLLTTRVRAPAPAPVL